jgi:hypothetical protein
LLIAFCIKPKGATRLQDRASPYLLVDIICFTLSSIHYL